MLLVALYLLTVLAANLAVQYIGLVPVAPGLVAPAGVYFVGLVLVLRDFVHERYGIRGSLIAIGFGSLLSLLLASPQLVLASVVAFAVAELLDLLVYVPTRRRLGFVWGVALSGIVGSIIDSALFLWLAFGSLDFFAGQLVGKLAMTAAAVVVLTLARRRRVVA
jgi:queuosine precursor transporter